MVTTLLPPPPPVNFDFDGLGSNVAGTEMYGLDVLPGVSTDFIGIAPTSFSTTEGYVDEAFKQFRNPNDLITIGGDLLAIDHIGKRLHLINLSSGALTSVELLGEGTYVGLASLPVPEPATVALLGVGLAGLAAAEVRRRRKKRAVDKS